MNKKKIFNDPVYGFVSLPYDIVFDLIEHPYFQRLRRIKQVSLSGYVYPGALHTRFHHAMGALHLMSLAVEVLRSKDVDISEEEAQSVSIAILLHAIGHGPFSHTLERTLVTVPHEELSLPFMERLNEIFEGKLSLAIQIFKDQHPKKFLHQLISGQLDMDRLDYLSRDSFFTGVSEGVISYDRIIKMLAVKDGELVVEEKGIYSIEKFLIARRLMYWQVYLHKTVLVAEQMLVKTLERAKELALSGIRLDVSKSLAFFLYQNVSREDFAANGEEMLRHFSRLDDYDILAALKNFTESEDPLLAWLSTCLLDRRLFKIELRNEPFER
ncbi:MAG: HD domain-containing protein, partial [Bacteroidota bacterium]